MENLKCNQKSHKLKKKFQIFTQPPQKQNMSLQVHDQLHQLTQLVYQSKNQQSNHIQHKHQYIQNQQSNPKFIIHTKQQIKPIKLTNQQKINQYKNIKNKCNSHSINTTAKVPLPFNHPHANFSVNNNGIAIDISNRQVLFDELSLLKGLLLNNEQRIAHLMDYVNSLYRNTIQLYTTHQKQLHKLVNTRCYQLTKIYKSALLTIKTHDHQLSQVDQQITLLLNTLKDTKQSLRLTKIKQQCIQALHQQINHEQKLQNIQYTCLNNDYQLILTPKQQQLPNAETSLQLITHPTYIKTSRSKQNDPLKNPSSKPSQQNILQKSPLTIITPKQQFRKSPFETNQILMISSTMPTIPNKAQLSLQTVPQYSFRKQQQTLKPTYHFNQSPYPHNQQKSTQIQKKLLDNKYLQKKQKLQSILNHFNKKQVWIDNLNCLRFKNGSYLLDKQGNAFICSSKQFYQLIDQNVITISHKN